MKRQIIIDSIAFVSFIIGTFMLLLGESALIRAIGAFPHYFGLMVFLAGADNWKNYLKWAKK